MRKYKMKITKKIQLFLIYSIVAVIYPTTFFVWLDGINLIRRII